MEQKHCLNGFWDFAVGDDSLYELPETWAETKIQVPSPFNINSFAHGYGKKSAGEAYYVQGADFRLYPEYERAWEKASRGFYRRYLDIPEKKEGWRLFLRFDAVAYRSVFYLNGEKLAEETEAFLPIEIEITDAVRYGKRNELVVGAETALVQNYKDENGRNRTDLPRGSFWGEHIGGIWQDCWLVERSEEYIKDIFAVTQVEERKLVVRCEIDRGKAQKEADSAYQLRFLLEDATKGELLTLGETGDFAESVERNVEKEFEEPAPNGLLTEFVWDYPDGAVTHWEPQNPKLYQLTVQLIKDGMVVDEKEVRIGFRTLRAQGSKFLLNGKPIRLKCDAWHYMGYAVQTPEYARSYYALAKKVGINIIRLHAQPFPEFFYDIADEMGMLLVDESAVWASHCCFSYNDTFFENSRKHLVRLVLRDRNHPSVVMWSPENECIPAYKVCGSAFLRDEKELEQKLYDFLSVIYDYDTSRLISCDGSGDLGGRLPVNSLHYPGYELCTEQGKPITIGEMGSMYYSTPDQVCMEYGQSVLESFEGRLLAVAADAYRNLMGERRWAEQVCVFNLIWYGLRPLPFSERLLTYPEEETPGIKPSRITPYLRTLNAGADENLPEYVFNPVGEMLTKAYREEWFYIENLPCGVYAGEAECLKAYLYNDTAVKKHYKLTVQAVCGDAFQMKKAVCSAVEACDFATVELAFSWEVPAGEYKLFVALSCEGKEIASECHEIHVYDKKQLWMQFCRILVRGADTEEKKELCAFFTAEGRYMARTKQKVSVLKKEGSNGIPVCFDGAGNPLVLAVYKNGAAELVSGIRVDEETDPEVVKMLCDVAAKCGRYSKRTAQKAYFYGNDEGNAANMLRRVHCDYRTVDEESCRELFKHRQEALLILDGEEDLDVLEGVGAHNFSTVLVVNAKTTPKPFYHDFAVTKRQRCHLVPTEESVAENGLYSTKLYGLAEGKELALSNRLLAYRDRESKAIYIEEPRVDWRMWNFNAEGLKTVSVHRGERKERSGFCAYSRHDYAGSSIYFAQFRCDTEDERLDYIWSCILTSLGAAVVAEDEEPRQRMKEDAQQRMSGKEMANAKREKKAFSPQQRLGQHVSLPQHEMYEDGLKRMLAVPAAAKEEAARLSGADSLAELSVLAGDKGWQQDMEEGQKLGQVLLAVDVESAQERTDFLLNPDTVDMQICAQKKVACYLNGSFLGEGTETTFTSIKLRRGHNLLCCYMEEEALTPRIWFVRKGGETLDLKFRV